MARSELVIFIKRELSKGKDPVSIRQHLMTQNIDRQSIDEAFDSIFHVHTNSAHEKFMVIGIVIALIIFVGSGIMFYFDAVPTHSTGPSSIIDNHPVPANIPEELKIDSICGIENSEERYSCFVTHFENKDLECYQIQDSEERDFCYRVFDWYALSA